MHLIVIAGLRLMLGSNQVVLGPDAPRALEVKVEGVRGTPHVEVNVGRITPLVQSSQNDRWIATWRPPRDASPRVALFAVWDDADAERAVLPLWGTATLPVQADAPDAEITLEVAGRKFTGHAGRDGRAVISFVAPPGPRIGVVHAVDRLGNMSNKEV